MTYKPHIDGLRAFAVMSVLLYHMLETILPGGYVGVDIFFVISGYLITSILISSMVREEYSLLEFYKRRILRILPALSFVLVVSILLSIFILLPPERIELGKSVAATSTFVSNIFFWSQSRYFDAQAEIKPLLHTWSLAVEEQFYLFFPPLLFLIMKYARKHVLAVVVGLSAVSFFGSVFTLLHYPSMTFYHLPPRAWELGLGAILAIYLSTGRTLSRGRLALAAIGLVLILAPVFLLSGNSLFPGWNAFPPCLGAMLLIGWAEGNPVGRFLSFGPFVWIGKISYSLYLWHWPVLVFWKIHTDTHLDGVEVTALIATSFLLAATSTYWIEKPFRSERFRLVPARRVVAYGVSVLVLWFGCGLSLLIDDITHYACPPEVRKIASVANYNSSPIFHKQFRDGICFIEGDDGTFDTYDKTRCASVEHSRPNVLLIGDSHASQYWGALQEIFPDVNIMQANASGCPSLLGVGGAAYCTEMRDWVFEEFLPNNRLDAVVLAGRWPEDKLSFVRPTLERLSQLVPSVVLVGPTVEYYGVLPLLAARSVWNQKPVAFDNVLVPSRKKVNDELSRIARDAGVVYVDVLEYECQDSGCIVFASDGIPMQMDYGHLTFSGAREVISNKRATFAKAFGVR